MRSKLNSVLLIILFASCISNVEKESNYHIPDNWESINDLRGNWINIERDSTGYLLYDPCDGQTPGIMISKDSLILQHQLEEPTALPINQVFITKDSITINTNSNILTAEFIFKLVEPASDFILFKWNYPKFGNSGKQVITKEVLSKNLKKIKNTCENEKVPELEFLAVEYD